jgi:hypothetical protein
VSSISAPTAREFRVTFGYVAGARWVWCADERLLMISPTVPEGEVGACVEEFLTRARTGHGMDTDVANGSGPARSIEGP